MSLQVTGKLSCTHLHKPLQICVSRIKPAVAYSNDCDLIMGISKLMNSMKTMTSTAFTSLLGMGLIESIQSLNDESLWQENEANTSLYNMVSYCLSQDSSLPAICSENLVEYILSAISSTCASSVSVSLLICLIVVTRSYFLMLV